jgi:hypothetical protein
MDRIVIGALRVDGGLGVACARAALLCVRYRLE